MMAGTLHELAVTCQKQQEYEEAERLHLEVLDIQRQQLVENHWHTLGTVKDLIALHAAWDKPQEAREWFQVLHDAYAQRSAASGYGPAPTGIVGYDSAMDTYTLTVPPSSPWTIEKELNFSLPEPSSEMWHVCDDLHFAYKTLHGDGSITAKMESIDPAHYGTEASVMIRNTLDPTSPHASVVITPLNDLAFRYRTIELGSALSTYDTINNVELPHWVRLTRTGNLFAAQHSSDGVNWEHIQGNNLNPPTSIIPMKESIHIGVAVASHNPQQAARARISHVTVTGSVSTSGPFTASQDINLRAIALQKE